MSINRNRANRLFAEHTKVGSAMAARYETCPVTGNCERCFPHGPETRNSGQKYRLRERLKGRYLYDRRQARQFKEWQRLLCLEPVTEEDIEW
jgi:hypothetical protein